MQRCAVTYRTVFIFAAVAGIALPSAAAAPRTRAPKAAIELTPSSASALVQFEVEVTDSQTSAAKRHAVSDAAMFVAKSGGDAQAALAAPEGAGAAAGAAHFTVRLFIVADGRLYTGGRGQCGAWQNDVARCSAACDGGSFAVRRNGAAPVELLIGAVPGGEAGSGRGIAITGCGFDEDHEIRLVAKAGRGLAVAGFRHD
ncbi:MAG: hypothetical protein HOP09_01520 [Hyphomicrobium sp.]|nr:hypothetical protein [Hyphomicrobium sp.]